jgi:acetyl-CoA carboxylase alpha subunit
MNQEVNHNLIIETKDEDLDLLCQNIIEQIITEFIEVTTVAHLQANDPRNLLKQFIKEKHNKLYELLEEGELDQMIEYLIDAGSFIGPRQPD